MIDRLENQSVKRFHASACVIAAFLKKLAKHLALIACLMVVGKSTGRFAGGELAIFLSVAVAVLLDCTGSFLRRRLSPAARIPRLSE